VTNAQARTGQLQSAKRLESTAETDGSEVTCGGSRPAHSGERLGDAHAESSNGSGAEGWRRAVWRCDLGGPCGLGAVAAWRPAAHATCEEGGPIWTELRPMTMMILDPSPDENLFRVTPGVAARECALHFQLAAVRRVPSAA